MAMDYGKKRIGLALVDTEVGVVLPYGKLETRNWKLGMSDVVKEQGIAEIVVGLPLGLDGKENENTGRVRLFAEDLKKETDVPIAFVDERFTTREAERMGGDVSADEKAAMLILRSYVERLKS